LFTFNVKHVLGTRHKGPEALSHRPGTEEELRELTENWEKAVQELKEFVDEELAAMAAEVGTDEDQLCSGFCTNRFHSLICFSSSIPDCSSPLSGLPRVSSFHFRREDYAVDAGLQLVGDFLVSLRRPTRMGDAEFKKFKNHEVKFVVREGVLYRRGKAGLPPRRVVVKEDDKKQVLKQLHDRSGHRGRDGTYQKVKFR
jgi:hypothetical protein